MGELRAVTTPAEWRQLQPGSPAPGFEPELLERHAPDAHWILQDSPGMLAHCSLWWQHTPAYPHQRVGCIGHYHAENLEAARLLLDHACTQLRQNGCTLAIAPIDGNTWRRYRCLSDRGSEPLFFLEPDNPDGWCDQFLAAGFQPLAQYSSALNPDLTYQDDRLVAVRQRLQQQDVRLRSLCLDDFAAEIERIYQLSLVSFRHNFLYTPISAAEFTAQYRPIQPYLQPDLVLLAEQHGQLVGFLFALPDLLQGKRGQPIDTVILKTVAVLPGRAYAGLGNLLVAEGQAIAHHLGYRRALHALMHNANHSRNLSARYAQTIRRYTLYARPLG